MLRTYFTLLALSAFVYKANSQTPTIQDCLGAIPVCQEVYTEAASPSGDGNYNNEINVNNSCTAGELNSIWYVFTASENGDLGFVITPNDNDDDYDWALFDITNSNCGSIGTNPNLQVSCNAAGGGSCHGPTGATGATNWDVQGAGCGASPPTQTYGDTPFNDLVPMTEGHTYVLMVSNWSGSPNGYKLDFGLSSGLGIYDIEAPLVASVQNPTHCYQNNIQVTFNEFVKCNSVSNDNFQLTGPGGPYTLSVSNAICLAGGDHAKVFDLTISPSIQAMGNYTLEFISSGNNEVVDLCANPAASISLPFMVSTPVPVSVNIGADTSLLCNGDLLTISAAVPGSTAYLWSTGSTAPDIQVSSAGIYDVTVTTPCGSGTDGVEVFTLFDVPQLNLGPDTLLCTGANLPIDLSQPFTTYLWQDGSTVPNRVINTAGTYQVSVTNVCGTVMDNLDVGYIPPIQLNLGADLTLCQGVPQTFDVSHPFGVYEWQNGSTGPTFTVSSPGNYAVTVSSPCESKSDDLSVVYINPPQLALSPDTILCAWQNLTYDLTVPGGSYEWQDGSSNPIYTITQGGNYAVTVTHACGTFEAAVAVTKLDSIRTELGRDTFLCAGMPIILNATAPAALASYKWSDGSADSLLFVKEAGVYVVIVSNVCEQKSDEVEIKPCEFCDLFGPSVFSPNKDGINDEFRPLSDCELANYRLRVFDRWGSQLFESTDPGLGWDGETRGKPCAAGVYVWWAEYTVVENNRARSASVTGDVTIIR